MGCSLKTLHLHLLQVGQQLTGKTDPSLQWLLRILTIYVQLFDCSLKQLNQLLYRQQGSIMSHCQYREAVKRHVLPTLHCRLLLTVITVIYVISVLLLEHEVSNMSQFTACYHFYISTLPTILDNT